MIEVEWSTSLGTSDNDNNNDAVSSNLIKKGAG